MKLLSDCCEAARVDLYYKSLHPKSEEECINSAHASLYEIKQSQNGYNIATQYLLNALLELSKGFNKGVGLSGEQLMITAELILDDKILPKLKLDDIKLCVRKAICGEYGECYGLDPNTVIVWLRKYMNNKVIVSEQIKEKERQEELNKPIVRDAKWHEAVDAFRKNIEKRRHIK